jgi:hypothetical protein
MLLFFKMNAIATSEVTQSVEYISDEVEEDGVVDVKLWNRENTLFLIHKIEESQSRFEKGVKKMCGCPLRKCVRRNL